MLVGTPGVRCETILIFAYKYFTATILILVTKITLQEKLCNQILLGIACSRFKSGPD